MLRNIALMVAAVLSLSIVSPASAQAQQAQSNGGIVAVLDLALIFESDPTHKQTIQQLETDAEKMKADFQNQQVALQTRAKEASTTLNGEALNSMEVKLQQDNVSLQVKARQAQADLMKREAEAYYQTYNRVMQQVDKVCKDYNVSVVLRWDSTPIDPANPGTVIRGVQRSVVFAKFDLTPVVAGQMGIKLLTPQERTANASAASGTQQQ